MIMKKLFFLVILAMSISFTIKAQDQKDKVKKTTTLGQKVHNTFSHHKKHKGYKTKHKHNGLTRKHKVNSKTGEVKNKVN
jgi:choline-glycine betaine transporter